MARWYVLIPGWYTHFNTRDSQELMMTSSNGNIFRVTGHLCGEFTGLRKMWLLLHWCVFLTQWVIASACFCQWFMTWGENHMHWWHGTLVSIRFNRDPPSLYINTRWQPKFCFTLTPDKYDKPCECPTPFYIWVDIAIIKFSCQYWIHNTPIMFRI